MRKVLCLLVCYLFMCTAIVRAQDPYYTVLNRSTGFPSNSIYDIFQDKRGFIWIASNEGLTRYDGFEFKTYTSSKQTSRSGNDIKEDKYGRIWYKNFDGYLYYIENDTLKPLKQNLPVGNTGYAILNDRLLVLQGKGLDYFNLRTLKIERSQGMDLHTNGGQLEYRGRYYLSFKNFLHVFSENKEEAVIPLSKGGMLAGSKEGLLIVDKGNPEGYAFEVKNGNVSPKIDLHGLSYIHSIDYVDGCYWMFTPNGVWAYDESGKNINEHNTAFFPKLSISCVMKDREGNFWFGTLDNGIIFVSDMKTRLYTFNGFTPSVMCPLGNEVLLGTKDNSIYRYGVAAHSFSEVYKDAIRHELLFLVHDTMNHRFYFSSDKFVALDEQMKVVAQNGVAIKEIAVVDKKYVAFAASGAVGLLLMNERLTSPWDSIFKATQRDANYMCELIGYMRGRGIKYDVVTGTLYSGSSRGLFKITPRGAVELLCKGESIYTRRMVSFGSGIYMLSSQNKLFKLDRNGAISEIPVTEENEKLLDIKVTSGNLCMVSTFGIKLYDTLSGRAHLLKLRPGIRTEEINDLDILNGKLMIASDKGIIEINLSDSISASVAPVFIVNSVAVNGSLVESARMNKLAHGENDIDISYSVLAFNNADRYRLYYKINEGKWQLSSDAARELKLASLAPGDYNIGFELRSETGKVLTQTPVRFTILKPFWTEWWFWLTCLIVLSAGSYAYYKWQTDQLKKQNALVLEKVELEKNLRNSMLTSIRAQMNPHFFYNALNAIQSFIFADDKRNASTYLVKLSRLTRTILEMSEKESVSLDEETEALTLYLELEKMRFNNDFHFEMTMGSNFDSELIKIPPMIVQPYVENAIKHGLLHKKGNKYLSISFIKDNGTLCVTIDDNGIGREKAGELRQIKKEKHHPFATYANSKRIELLNKERSKDIGVVYTDKKDEHGSASGTTVVISIQLN